MSITRTAKVALLGLAIALIATGGFVGYRYYDKHHISSELRRTLTAAMDPAASDADFQSYMRGVRLAVRTKKDAEVVAKFQTAYKLTTDASKTMDRLLKEATRLANGEDEEYRRYRRLVQIRSGWAGSHMPIPKQLNDDIDKAAAEEKARAEQWKKEYDDAKKRSADDFAAAEKLINEVRADLGLPPIQNQN